LQFEILRTIPVGFVKDPQVLQKVDHAEKGFAGRQKYRAGEPKYDEIEVISRI
jgi:hypothetical protein